jgi:hypothetical protein
LIAKIMSDLNAEVGVVTVATEEQIKELAHAIWEKEGRPHGKAVEHYFRAKQILEEQEASRLLELAPPAPLVALAPPPPIISMAPKPSKHRKYTRRKER